MASADKRRLAVLFHRFGPYHIARLNAAAPQFALEGVELSSADKVYAWSLTSDGEAFRRHMFCDDVETEPAGQLIRRMDRLLSALEPEAVAIPGWSHRGALAALLWCQRTGVPAILMSESTVNDGSRRIWKEAVKRRIVALCSAAMVGGEPHRAYLLELGMPAANVFDGYDVVDNEHFSRQADVIRKDAANVRRRFDLPERYFLVSCRFVAKKNLLRLIDAYYRYRNWAGPAAWHLVLVGDGELRPQLEERVTRNGHEGVVHMAGFRQYDDLPAYYALAGAFVHASVIEQWGLVVNEAMAAGLPVLVSDRCGCAADLICCGGNGFRFNPYDPDELAILMLHVASDECDRARLAAASRELIGKWTPERFVSNLRRAVEAALATPVGTSLVDRLLVRGLTLRQDTGEP